MCACAGAGRTVMNKTKMTQSVLALAAVAYIAAAIAFCRRDLPAPL